MPFQLILPPLFLAASLSASIAQPPVHLAHSAPKPVYKAYVPPKDHVVKAGETLILDKKATKFNRLTIEEGGRVLFKTILRVNAHGTYIRKHPEAPLPIKAIWARKVRFNHACTLDSPWQVLFVKTLVDNTKAGAFHQEVPKRMTLEEYESCTRLVPRIEIKAGIRTYDTPNYFAPFPKIFE